MKLNPSKGNMYDFITHTGNAIKGICPHDCSYCYVKRWGNLKDVRLDEKELSGEMTYKGIAVSGEFIFIGSSCDMFADDIPDEWIKRILDYCVDNYSNKYLFQSKNPSGFQGYNYLANTVFCTTIETNRFYKDIMRYSPYPFDRAYAMGMMSGFKRYVTIEPILDFDIDELVNLIKICEPEQVNIGADSGGNKLPEPSAEKIMTLIGMLSEFTTIHHKNNLKRLIKS